MKLSFNQSIIVVFSTAILLTAFLGYQSLRGIDRLVDNTRGVEHTQNVIEHLQTLLTEVEDQARTMRSFVLTGNPAYLQTFRNASHTIPVQIQTLKDLTADNPGRQGDFVRLEKILNRHGDALERLSQSAQPINQPSVAPRIEESNQLIDQIKTQVVSIQNDERYLLQQRTDAAVESSRRVREIVAVGSVGGVGLLGFATLFLHREMQARQHVEETLRQNEERSRLMIESVKDYAFIMLDPEGRVASWNAGAERLKGYRAEEIIGRHFSCFYPEEKKRDEFPEKELREAKTKGRFEDENWRVRKDGSQFWANVVITAVRDTNDQLLGFVKVIRDITARKQAEERIQKLNEDLKQRANQLETSNKELEAFSYSVSHDLRAPLRHIHGFVELLQKSPVIQSDKAGLRQLGIIAAAAKQMGVLIDDLLAFSRTGRIQMYPTKIDQRDLIDRVIQDLDMEIRDRQVTWLIHPLPAVTGDPALLRLVWTNLLSNAVKFTQRCETAKIEIGHAATNGQNHGVPEEVFYVRDNGVGFDMQYAAKLFGVFQRLHRQQDFEGTGIGLANVQRIVHRHGGRVWAESKIDLGSVFYYSLPIDPVKESHDENKTNSVG